MGKFRYFGIFLAALLLVLAPAMGAKITEFNGVSADTVDQVSHLVIAKDQSGNVTIRFDNNTNGWTITSTLVIDFAVNISGYSYTASGDTANLTVTQNPTNLTFSYSGTTNVTISNVDLIFDFGKGYNTSQGIDSGTVMNASSVLAYVSAVDTSTYNESTTPEKVTYIVYDPAKVYKYTATVTSADGNVSTTIGTEVNINLTKATTNKVEFAYTLTRDVYGESLVPIHKAYFHVFLNDTYFTNVVPVPKENVTDVGLKESDGYTEVIFIDVKPAENSSFNIIAYAWDTNGTIKDGYKFQYEIDPIGGLKATSTETKNVTIVVPAALVAPPTALYWWQYEIAGISVLAWIGIIVTLAIIGLMIYRKAKGLPLFPRSLGGLSSIVGVYMLLTLWSQITQWMQDAYSWLQQNWLIVSLIFVVALILLIIGVFHYGTTRE